MNIYIREKITGVAVLRCLGLKARTAFLIYLIQVLGIGLVGSLLGAGLGVVVQQVLPMDLIQNCSCRRSVSTKPTQPMRWPCGNSPGSAHGL